MGMIGIGTWAWGNELVWGYNPIDDNELRDSLKLAIKGGLNFIDTADSYGTGKNNGRSEELLGKFLEIIPDSDKNKITVATKLAPYPWRQGKRGFKKAYFSSKKRLKGKLDIVQLHWSTSRYFPWQEVDLIDGLCDLCESGERFEIGISNMGEKRLEWFSKRLKKRNIQIKTFQTQYSLLSPNNKGKNKIKALCKNLNIGFWGYSPLALGILAVSPDNNLQTLTIGRNLLYKRLIPKSQILREELFNIATNRRVSQVQVALNWTISHGVNPIVGIRKTSQAREIIQALTWNLSKNEKETLDLLSEECIDKMPENPFQSN